MQDGERRGRTGIYCTNPSARIAPRLFHATPWSSGARGAPSGRRLAACSSASRGELGLLLYRLQVSYKNRRRAAVPLNPDSLAGGATPLRSNPTWRLRTPRSLGRKTRRQSSSRLSAFSLDSCRRRPRRPTSSTKYHERPSPSHLTGSFVEILQRLVTTVEEHSAAGSPFTLTTFPDADSGALTFVIRAEGSRQAHDKLTPGREEPASFQDVKRKIAGPGRKAHEKPSSAEGRPEGGWGSATSQ